MQTLATDCAQRVTRYLGKKVKYRNAIGKLYSGDGMVKSITAQKAGQAKLHNEDVTLSLPRNKWPEIKRGGLFIIDGQQYHVVNADVNNNKIWRHCKLSTKIPTEQGAIPAELSI